MPEDQGETKDYLPCQKCGKAMERGFILDEAYGHHRTSEWAQGRPEQYFMLGIVPLPGAIQDPDVRIPVVTFRCPSCGYLESYARREFKAKQ